MKFLKVIRNIIIGIFILCAIAVFLYRDVLFAPIVQLKSDKEDLFIPTGGSLQTVIDTLSSNGWVENPSNFKQFANMLGLKRVFPGRYILTNGMTAWKLYAMLKGGLQTPVQVRIKSYRTLELAAGRIGAQLELDSSQILEAFTNPDWLLENNLNKENAISVIMPEQYEFYWNVGAEKFRETMLDYYTNFWNDTRLEKAERIPLTKDEVIVLASIVQAEQTVFTEEHSTIAGLYINRLRKGMPLQSDPTVVFAHRNFSIKRLLNKDKDIDSPYNTYKYKGLPPGPINMPFAIAIDAVLDFEENNFLYMCARSDFSGYHHFSDNMDDHLQYARQYQRELNKRGIKR